MNDEYNQILRNYRIQHFGYDPAMVNNFNVKDEIRNILENINIRAKVNFHFGAGQNPSIDVSSPLDEYFRLIDFLSRRHVPK